MELNKAIITRRSTRKYFDKSVDWDDVSKIIDSARYAPSAGNVQDWRFIVVRDEEKISEISNACLSQKFVGQVPVVIVVCSNVEKIKREYGLRGEKLYSIQNCAAAIQNMLLTATDLGLASCWTGAFDEDKIRTILSIPGTVRPQAVLPIGYAAEKLTAPKREELTHLIYFEKYGNKIDDIDAVLNNWGKVMQRDIKEGVKSAGKTIKKVVEKVKKRLKKNNSKK